jgi:hypothetical protein
MVADVLKGGVDRFLARPGLEGLGPGGPASPTQRPSPRGPIATSQTFPERSVTWAWKPCSLSWRRSIWRSSTELPYACGVNSVALGADFVWDW